MLRTIALIRTVRLLFRSQGGVVIVDDPSLAELLRRHRQAARLTLEQLADVSGVSARTLSDMERGRSRGPQHRTVVAVAQALALAEADRKRLVEMARDGRLRDHWGRPSGLCELPRAVDDFTGRGAELGWIDALARTPDPPGSALVGLVTGSAGSGKTSFVIRAAHTLRPDFADGVLFLDLLGMATHPRSSFDALGLLLGALGITERQVPTGPEERASLYRSLLGERRILVVLDNAASEEQVRPLLGAGGSSRVLVTSRRLLAGMEGVRRLVLGPLQLPEATELLTGIVGERAATDGQAALDRLARLCGGLPLALRIIGNRLVSRPRWSAQELAARLADEERRLEQFTAGDLKIANAFGMSYEQLGSVARRVFRRLAAVPGPDFDAALAAVAGGIGLGDSWDALDELVDLGLLQDGTSGRYRFHDLVGLFARDRLRREESQADRTTVALEVRSWLLRMATMAGRWFEPGYGKPDRPGLDLTVLATTQEADTWLRANVDSWLGALRQARAAGEDQAVLDCAESMHWYSDRWIHGPHWREVFTLGAEAAASLGDLPQQATQLNYLSWVHSTPMNDPVPALRYATQALDLAVRSGAAAQVAWAHNYQSVAQRKLGQFDAAVSAAYRAVDSFKALGDNDSHLTCMGNLAHCLRDAGRHREAVEHYHEAIALLDDGYDVAPTLAEYLRTHMAAGLGLSLRQLGERAQAITALTQADSALGKDPSYVNCLVLEALAPLLAETGRVQESRRAYARAAEVYEAIGDVEGHRRCRRLAVTE
ncbi:tetratricopeptide repeat protein [Streptomyces sp. NPDC048297]|uniref:tetratricopeptide repeat protein n=1 Tax=Streptomyces sp. NPDC048297 TaxID=3365531 RepID=UPI00371F92AF